MELVFISKNQNGDYYVGFKIKVNRGIRGKTKSKVDELIIVGIPKDKFPEFCKDYDISQRKVDESLFYIPERKNL